MHRSQQNAGFCLRFVWFRDLNQSKKLPPSFEKKHPSANFFAASAMNSGIGLHTGMTMQCARSVRVVSLLCKSLQMLKWRFSRRPSYALYALHCLHTHLYFKKARPVARRRERDKCFFSCFFLSAGIFPRQRSAWHRGADAVSRPDDVGGHVHRYTVCIYSQLRRWAHPMKRESADTLNPNSFVITQWQVMLRDEVALLAMRPSQSVAPRSPRATSKPGD